MKKNHLYKGLVLSVASAVLLMSQPMSALANGAQASSINKEAQSQTDHFTDGNYYYATVNLPYADFYYGELNTLTLSESVELQTEDPAASYRSAGQYDAVSSATTVKSTKFPTTYYEETKTGIDILGIKDVQIAIPVALYNDIQANKAKEGTCKNKLYEFFNSMTFSETAFSEYKILNGDGTFTAMTTATTAGFEHATVAADATATITTDSVWGNYQISIEGINVDSSNMLGVLLTTSDGSVYGMEHLENLWLKTGELSFCIEDFVEVHGNHVDFLRHQSLPGKTITKITYLIKDGSDLEINVSLPVKKLLSAEDTALLKVDAVKKNTAGMTTSYVNGLADTKGYDGTLSSVTSSDGALDAKLYSVDAVKHTITLDGSLTPGAYTAIFTDNEYEDVKATFEVLSALSANDVAIKQNKLQITGSEATLSEYIAAITGVKVNSNAISGSSLGTILFNEDGSINFDSSVSFHGNNQAFFANGVQDDYVLSIEAAGYPSIETTVGRSTQSIPLTGIKLNTTALSLTKGKTATLTASLTPTDTTEAQAITFTSSNTKVAAVSSNGTVTATGCGTAVITAKAGDFSATCSVTVNHTFGNEMVLIPATTSKNGTLGKVCSCCQETVTTGTINKIASVSLSTTTYSYNGKNRTPSVKVKDSKGNTISSKYYTVSYDSKRSAVGIHNVKITFKGRYSGSVTKTYTIVPAKTTVKLSSPTKTGMTVKWKKTSGVSGYQISYSTSSKFNKAKTIKAASSASSKKLTKLAKNKKYFVRVRSYKTVKVNGKNQTIYSSWSTVTSAKTKK